MSLDISDDPILCLQVQVAILTELQKENLSLKLELAQLRAELDAKQRESLKKPRRWFHV